MAMPGSDVEGRACHEFWKRITVVPLFSHGNRSTPPLERLHYDGRSPGRSFAAFGVQRHPRVPERKART
eukprot:4728187-Prorocentrum_lima.AAC.1